MHVKSPPNITCYDGKLRSSMIFFFNYYLRARGSWDPLLSLFLFLDCAHTKALLTSLLALLIVLLSVDYFTSFTGYVPLS